MFELIAAQNLLTGRRVGRIRSRARIVVSVLRSVFTLLRQQIVRNKVNRIGWPSLRQRCKRLQKDRHNGLVQILTSRQRL